MERLNRRIVFAISIIAMLWGAAAQADDDDGDFVFKAIATGAQEVPAVDSDGHARVKVQFDKGLSAARVKINLHGIDTMVTAAHFHCARAGVNGPAAFGVMGPGQLTEIVGRARVTLTNADALADCTGSIGRPVNNIAALYFAMRDGLIYFNLHTASVRSGEVRGQMIQE